MHVCILAGHRPFAQISHARNKNNMHQSRVWGPLLKEESHLHTHRDLAPWNAGLPVVEGLWSSLSAVYRAMVKKTVSIHAPAAGCNYSVKLPCAAFAITWNSTKLLQTTACTSPTPAQLWWLVPCPSLLVSVDPLVVLDSCSSRTPSRDCESLLHRNTNGGWEGKFTAPSSPLVHPHRASHSLAQNI